MAKILFTEVQHFRGNPLWTVLLSLPLLIFFSMLCYQVFTGEPVGTHPMSNLSLSLLCALVLVPAVWAWSRVKLTTVIDENRISYGWNMPTAELNEIPLQDIREWSVIRYNFVGYGYRLSRKYGTIHNLSGNQGLQIVTNSGEKVLIGTHRAAELQSVLNNLLKGETQPIS